jgi:Nucleotidyl transferase AbiEii toxin, Type IV TA system
MVRGLDRFLDAFSAHSHQYALIGGTACELLLGQVDLPFRATKDLDIVLMSEMLDTAFATDFWRFVRHGQYKVAESTGGTPRFYRFSAPQDASFPSMIELFSTRPERLPPASGQTLTPIPFDDPVSSLSAIVLDETYYAFLKGGVRLVEGMSVVGPEHLVPLKARAWLDLREHKTKGRETDTKDIVKHFRDVFRLYQILDPAPRKDIVPLVSADMQRFLVEARSETISLKSLGITNTSLDEVLAQLGRIYGAE